MPILKFDQPKAIHLFIRSAQESTQDLSDPLIAHSAIINGCDVVIAFDKKAAKSMFFEQLTS
ncbi:MAG: hypothetical protein KKD44_07435 [Proteobacteria bacterium]|nr:hypothetical protein [Pseudomonadota bacterium]